MDAGQVIRRAVPVLVQYGTVEQGILLLWLIRAGIPKADALEAMRFIPLAFARDVIKDMGMSLPDTYVRMTADGWTKEVPLNDERMFRAASYMASIIAKEIGMDAFTNIVVLSAEMQAVNNALNAGSNPTDLVVGPPVVPLQEGELLDQPTRPWWKFW